MNWQSLRAEGHFRRSFWLQGGGFHDQYSPLVFDKYRKRLLDDGFAVINVDFTSAHGISACADNNGYLISMEDYAKDILAAVTDLAKDSSIDPNRIHVIGWSYGGGASFSALALAERQSVKINSVVAFFPYCKGALAWKQPTPVLTFVGLADNIAPFAQCKDLVKDALDNKSMRRRVPRRAPFLRPVHGRHSDHQIVRHFWLQREGCDPIVVGTGGLPKEVTMTAYWALRTA